MHGRTADTGAPMCTHAQAGPPSPEAHELGCQGAVVRGWLAPFLYGGPDLGHEQLRWVMGRRRGGLLRPHEATLQGCAGDNTRFSRGKGVAEGSRG